MGSGKNLAAFGGGKGVPRVSWAMERGDGRVDVCSTWLALGGTVLGALAHLCSALCAWAPLGHEVTGRRPSCRGSTGSARQGAARGGSARATTVCTAHVQEWWTDWLQSWGGQLLQLSVNFKILVSN